MCGFGVQNIGIVSESQRLLTWRSIGEPGPLFGVGRWVSGSGGAYGLRTRLGCFRSNVTGLLRKLYSLLSLH